MITLSSKAYNMILKSLDRIRFALILNNNVKIVSDECKFIEDILKGDNNGTRN